MDTEGEDQQKLSNTQYVYNNSDGDNLWFKPALSPDSTQIAFASHSDGNYEIFVIDVASGDVKQLMQNTVNDTSPVWLPDSAQIAFSRSGEGLYLMDADGAPVWSPDGTRIVFTRHAGSNPQGDGEIFVMDADGSNATRLADGQAPVWLPRD